MPIPKLPLEEMSSRHPGLIPCLEETCKKSAAVILDKYYRSPEVFLLRDDKNEFDSLVEWEEPDARTKAALNNKDDSKCDGAYIISLAALELSRGMVAIGRTDILSGADYYVAPIGSELDDLENAYKLEVSGTESDLSGFKTRLNDKVEQAKRGNCNLPALAAVVGYKIKQISIKTVEE
jgi:hypothetical protein